MVSVLLFLTPGPPSDQDWAGASPPPAPYPAPPLELEDLDGERVNLASFRGWTTVVFFGYTHCPDVCPATLLNLSRAMDELGRRADRVRLVFVTVDPERDTPDRLREWLANFHPEITALRGTEAEIREVASAWGIHVGRSAGQDGHAHHGEALPEEVAERVTPGAPGAYGVDHSSRSFVLDRSGRIVLFLAPFQGGEAMAADLRRVIR